MKPKGRERDGCWEGLGVSFLYPENFALISYFSCIISLSGKPSSCPFPTQSDSESGSHDQLCPMLCDTVICSPPGSSVHGILQARILEWVGISFSRGSSPSRDRTLVSCIPGRFFTV